MPAAPPETMPIETSPAIVPTTEISTNLRRHAAAVRGAFAANTERALRGDIARFTGWCSREGHQAMPASPDTVAAFIDALAASKAPATVRRHVSSVATFHRAAGSLTPATARM
jgi:site-specific recombinase XerD